MEKQLAEQELERQRAVEAGVGGEEDDEVKRATSKQWTLEDEEETNSDADGAGATLNGPGAASAMLADADIELKAPPLHRHNGGSGADGTVDELRQHDNNASSEDALDSRVGDRQPAVVAPANGALPGGRAEPPAAPPAQRPASVAGPTPMQQSQQIESPMMRSDDADDLDAYMSSVIHTEIQKIERMERKRERAAAKSRGTGPATATAGRAADNKGELFVNDADALEYSSEEASVHAAVLAHRPACGGGRAQ